MKPHKVEFYRTYGRTPGTIPDGGFHSWRLRSPNNQIILTPHETFVSLNNAVRSFKTVCKAMNAQTVFEVDGEASIKARAVRLLTR